MCGAQACLGSTTDLSDLRASVLGVLMVGRPLCFSVLSSRGCFTGRGGDGSLTPDGPRAPRSAIFLGALSAVCMPSSIHIGP